MVQQTLLKPTLRQKLTILAPRGSIHWDAEVMRKGSPARRTYHAAIFNPARLKVAAMLSGMPKKYGKNLPEAELIPLLIAGAQAALFAELAS